mmetsp:Transcript_32332/g.54490  ORF Transcript_32332/g.54490 Transcript_32332/m.54490 type:complete len:97 (-) Transcript_32332:1399-1689(-)
MQHVLQSEQQMAVREVMLVVETIDSRGHGARVLIALGNMNGRHQHAAEIAELRFAPAGHVIASPVLLYNGTACSAWTERAAGGHICQSSAPLNLVA